MLLEEYEILSYRKPEFSGGGWYSKHLPIYVSMAEAARLLGQSKDMLEICTIITARYGIDLPTYVLSKRLGEGRLAFFFDGIDEVGNIEERIQLLTLINKLIDSYSPLGNRFVLTSRPAAIQTIEIPDGLTHIHLKGLSENEMRSLASKIVTSRLFDNSEQNFDADVSGLVERLMTDCRNTPGIRRIARNPLLLTLLVLVYANSGTLVARRHIVYSQAVKTLVSVRNRFLKAQVLSEADLRTRLGVLAFSMYKREIDEIPTRSEVLRVFQPIFESDDSNGLDKANAFIQEVAEATGLLVIHKRGDDYAQEIITFMHHSFLEYYAAIGFLEHDYEKEAPFLVMNSRWKDILTLMFGILSEQKDITNFLSRIIEDQTDADRITKRRLIFGMIVPLSAMFPQKAPRNC